MPDKAVLSYPYEGGMYYLMSKAQDVSRDWRGHPYYESLYGPTPEAHQVAAANLSALYETIILAPADAYLPDYHTYSVGGLYFHPDLRLSANMHVPPNEDDTSAARRLLRINEIRNTLAINWAHVDNSQFAEFLLVQVIRQIRLALQEDAALLGGKEVADLVKQVFFHMRHDLEIPAVELQEPLQVTYPDSHLSIIGLDWKCTSVDEFAEVRQSKEISQYAKEFRKCLESVQSSDDKERSLLTIMRRAMEQEEVSRKAKEAFETVGDFADILGAIPILGTATNLAGLTAKLATENRERSELHHKWYLLGPKMREVSLQTLLGQS